MKKKLLSILVATTLLLMCIPFGGISVSATNNGTYNGMTYEIIEGEVTITDYTDELPAGLVIPDTIEGCPVTAIGSGAFWACYKLTSLTIPDSVTSIDYNAFNGCSSLTSVFIGNSVTSIGERAFIDCSSLTTVTIGDNVTTIDYQAFYGCTSLTMVTIPDSVTVIERGAFSKCSSLSSVTIGNHVTTIGENAFERCTNLTTVSIPDSVVIIDVYAFSKCTNLTSVIISNSVTTIGMAAFWDCASLMDVYYDGSQSQANAIAISNGNDSLLTATWHYAKVEEPEVEEPEVNKPEIPAGLLYEIAADEVTITGYTDELPADLVIPNTIEGYPVTAIGNSAFDNCKTLSSVNIPNSIITIGDYAFAFCFYLDSVSIPDSVTSIGRSAFVFCFELTTVSIPDSVAFIGKEAFHGCNNLTTIEVDSKNIKYCSVDGVLFNKSKDELIQHPSCLKSGAYTIPNSVTTIGYGAFYHCSYLTSVTIPKSVTTISENAFGDCNNLTDIYYGGTETNKAAITIDSFNDSLLNAAWHYASAPIANEVQHSVMDTKNGNGLAYRFELTAKGIAKNNKNVMDLSNATIDYWGKECKLISMGTVVTNNNTVAEKLTLDTVNNYDVVNIPTVYLQEADEDSCAFAARIINIPDNQLERIIYARPYYIVEVDGEEITVYGEVDSASCAEYL